MRIFSLTIALVFFTAAIARGQVHVVDLDGRQVDPVQTEPAARAHVFIFTTTDCPIANRYAPELTRLHEAYSKHGVRFWLVYANPAEQPDAVRAHASKFRYPMSVLRDPRHDLVKFVGATVTPEAALVDRTGSTLYRGRIDDRYIEFGVERPAPSKRDLEEALVAITTGKAITPSTTRAIGCFIADFRPITFAQQIAPLVFDKCATCHRPTGPAPFSLLTYEEVRRRATQIVAVTGNRYMPPWRAVSSAGSFVGQKRLDDREIELIREWVAQGAVEGNARDTPPPPRFVDAWHLGTPDLIVRPQPYTLPAQPSDVFRIFVIRLPLSTTKYVTGVEFRPGNPRVVHHANIRLDPTDASRTLDEADPIAGYDGLMARSATYPDGHFLGWTPGQVAPLVPPDMAWRLDPGTDLVVQLHMQPSGAEELVQPEIGFFFSDRPPTRTPTILRLGSQGIDIAPGDPQYVVDDSYVLPVDVELHAIQPHAHYRLRELEGTATLPSGITQSLITITNWDFRWQHVYRFATPVALAKGTRLRMRYRYDNSAENPRNPQQPPRRVFWGQRSFDEMGDLWFQFTTKTDRDRFVLNSEVQRKMTAEDVIGYETMLRSSPLDAELHDDVAMLYLTLGRAGEAVKHFGASAQIKPAVAASHFNLATALSVAGKLDDAVRAYREALRLRPDYANAHNNLGMVLATQGKIGDALTHFGRASQLDPGHVQAHRNLAWYLAITSNDPAALEQAVAAGERAAQLTRHNDAHVLDALAAAYAAAGAFERAIATAERALSLTEDQSLRAAIRERLARYRRGR